MAIKRIPSTLPLPPHYSPQIVAEVWRVPYQERAEQAEQWKLQYSIQRTDSDLLKFALILVDVQNTFCIPGFELFVGGRSGIGAVEDNRRLCEFIYRNLKLIDHIVATMDTHRVMQIFHSLFLVNEKGEHPHPLTLISYDDVKKGIWRFNTELAQSIGITPEYGQKQLVHYVEKLKASGKYDLTIWPYHAILGGVGHALVSAVEEALFFFTIACGNQVDFTIKGDHPLTEHYSVLRPEVMEDPRGEPIAQKNEKFVQLLHDYDIVAIAGQAKSHCVAWTIADLLSEIREIDERLANKIYLLEDCMSPVVVPGVLDYTDQADKVFERFAAAGMHRVLSTDLVKNWPGLK